MANIKNKKKVVVDNSIGVKEAIELLKKACQDKQRKFVSYIIQGKFDLALNLINSID